VHDRTYPFKLRFRFLLGTASIAAVVNHDLPGCKDCLRPSYSIVAKPKRVAEKTKLWLVPELFEHRDVKAVFLMLPLNEVKSNQEH